MIVNPLNRRRQSSIARLAAEVRPDTYHDPLLVNSKSRVMQVTRYPHVLSLLEQAKGEGMSTTTYASIVGDFDSKNPEVTGIYYAKTIVPVDGPHERVVFTGWAQEVHPSGVICIKNMLEDAQQMKPLEGVSFVA